MFELSFFDVLLLEVDLGGNCVIVLVFNLFELDVEYDEFCKSVE